MPHPMHFNFLPVDVVLDLLPEQACPLHCNDVKPVFELIDQELTTGTGDSVRLG